MFGSLKTFAAKQLVKTQMGDVPPEVREMVMKLVESHPELLQEIATDMQAEMAAGKDQEAAMMTVMQKHEAVFKKLL